MAVNPYAKYVEQSIQTMTQGEMVIRLYEEIDKEINIALAGLETKRFEESNRAIQKCQRIIRHLKQTLNHQYGVAGELNKLYDFFLQQLLEANFKKDFQPLESILPMVVEMKNTFAQSEKRARIG